MNNKSLSQKYLETYLKSLAKKSAKNSQADAGFTLLELMAVVIIIAILSAIAGPSWIALTNRQKMNTASDRVFWAMQDAQSNAKRDKETWQASFKNENGVLLYAVHPVILDNNDDPTCNPANNEAVWEVVGKDVQVDEDNTTLPGETAESCWRSQFDYQGLPIDVDRGIGESGNYAGEATGRISVKIDNGNDTRKSCVTVETLLGGLHKDRDENCDT
ncbi:MAG: type II secretion system protein [Oscillatoria sp. PMC 1068.18]|nr:type II secretion system protein [Oscillatoria sp. PMC 1076.18]MEC4989539.1 type II secretion system protein [Oscillatoria sp. PMC 1068.18]